VNLPPLSLYVHLPWCVRKCPYCDFNSHTAGEAAPKERYIKALLMDLARESVKAEGRELGSIFLGGGTPSLFTPAEIEQVLAGVRASFSLSADVEVTMEANPGTVECGSPAGYRDAGVNRLSIGAQSFDDAMLKILGRIHSSADISRAVLEAAAAGFDNINIDLMHGLPHQTWTDASEDLMRAISFEPEHISWYQLTIEPNTVFYNYRPDLPNEQTLVQIYDSGTQLLKDQGYQRYEISAFSKPRHQSRHNLNYWLFGDYLGIGAGAHGKFTTADGIFRTVRTRMPSDYLANPSMKATRVSEQDLPLEFMMNALRLIRGCDLSTFEQRTQLDSRTISPFLETAYRKGLLTDPKSIRATARGLRFLDDLLVLDAPG